LAYDEDELIRWRSTEAIGQLAAVQAQTDPEKVRDQIRRLLWLMNDESGGLGWHSPEHIAEILVAVPQLIDEYAGLLPGYLREEPFQSGAHRAVFRVAKVDSRPFADLVDQLLTSLEDKDPSVRSVAALILGCLKATEAREPIKRLLKDQNRVSCYDFEIGRLIETSVRKMAEEALLRLDQNERAA
jgi:HEAT repeat protein